MNVGDTFTHNGIEYTVTSTPEEGVVKGRGVRTITDPNEGSPNMDKMEVICIEETDISG